MDVRETQGEFVVSAELPGLERDDVEVTVENGVLSLSGEKKEEFEEEDEESGRRIYERRYGRFQRTLSLPRGIDADKVNAKFKNGVLEVVLPKTPAAKSRQIEISAN